MIKTKLFIAAFLLTTGVIIGLMYINRPGQQSSKPPKLVRIGSDLFLTSQLHPHNVGSLKRSGINSIVDLRPDGESKDQASSSEIETASRNYGIAFNYIPVPHEDIPDGAVDALKETLSREAPPTVLYCRTGRRAARLYALVEASRVNGPSAEAILQMVSVAGFSAEDLKSKIDIRISHRDNAAGGNH